MSPRSERRVNQDYDKRGLRARRACCRRLFYKRANTALTDRGFAPLAATERASLSFVLCLFHRRRKKKKKENNSQRTNKWRVCLDSLMKVYASKQTGGKNTKQTGKQTQNKTGCLSKGKAKATSEEEGFTKATHRLTCDNEISLYCLCISLK